MKGEQYAGCKALTWLKSMAESDDIFYKVNAENALTMIDELERKNRVLGAAYQRTRNERDTLMQKLDRARERMDELSRSHGMAYGYFCSYCQQYVPTEWCPCGTVKRNARTRCGSASGAVTP